MLGLSPRAMQDVVQLFQEGGVWMYPILALSMVSFIAIIVSLVVVISTKGHEGKLSIVLVALGVLPILLGVVGRAVGLMRAEEALAYVSANDAERIRAMAHSEALAPVVLGVIVGLPALALAAAMLGRAAAKRLSSNGLWLGPIMLGLGVWISGVGALSLLFAARSAAGILAMDLDPSQLATIRAVAEAEQIGALWRIGVGLVPMAAGALFLSRRRSA